MLQSWMHALLVQISPSAEAKPSMQLHRRPAAFATPTPGVSLKTRRAWTCAQASPPPPDASTPAYPPGKATASRRVFVGNASLSPGSCIPLPSAEKAHLRACRAAPESSVTLLNASGGCATGVLDGNLSHATVTAASSPAATAPLTIALCAPRRPSRAGYAVEKLCELSATSIIFCTSSRSASSPSSTRVERWERIAASAAKQALTARVAHIRVADSFLCLVAEGFSAVLLCSPAGDPLLQTAMSVSLRNPLIIVGPEGGLTESEEDTLVASGARRVRLGGSRLRVETAAVAAAVAVGLARDAVRAERSRQAEQMDR